MSSFDTTPQRPRLVQNTAATTADVADLLVQPSPSATLARGIVWADILAEIAADEEARQLPAAESTQLRDAA